MQREIATIWRYVICKLRLSCIPATGCRPSLDDAQKIQATIFAHCKLLLLRVLRSNFSCVDRGNESIQLGLG